MPRRKLPSPDWFNASFTAVLTQAASNGTSTIFDVDALTLTSPFASSRSVLVRRVLIRVLAAATCSLANQLIHLAISLLVQRPGEAQFQASFSVLQSQIMPIWRTEVRSCLITTAGVPVQYDAAGGTPWVFDTGPISRRIDTASNLILASNAYLNGWAALPGVTTVGLDIQQRILFQVLDE